MAYKLFCFSNQPDSFLCFFLIILFDSMKLGVGEKASSPPMMNGGAMVCESGMNGSNGGGEDYLYEHMIVKSEGGPRA